MPSPSSSIKASSIGEVKEKLSQYYANVLQRSPPPSLTNDDDDVDTVSPDMDTPMVTGPNTTAVLRAALSTSELSSSTDPDDIPVIAQQIEEFEDNILDTISQS